MNWESILPIAAAAIASSAVLYFMSRWANQEAVESKDGMTIIKSHKTFQILGIIMLLLCGVALVLVLIYGDFTNIGLLIAFLLFILLFFGGIGALCILTYKNHFVQFDKDYFVVKSLKGKYTEMKWKDIGDAKYNGLSGYLVLKNKRGEKVKVSPYLIGFKAFVRELQRNTHYNADNLRLPFR